jgi:hypothetical protein
MAVNATDPAKSLWEDKGDGELILKNPDAVRPKVQSLEQFRDQLQEQFGIKPK